jgi:ribosomal protein S18 acetylase RimI-like enzyme
MAGTPVAYRRAQPSDAEAIAVLHADSWRRNYRGAYSDSFLDGDVSVDRLEVWTSRLRSPDPGAHTVVAEADEGFVGFGHTILEADTKWGALLENLHVIHDRRGDGIGTQLLARSAQAASAASSPGLFLWVLERNTAAQAFYQRRGGVCVERQLVDPPGGIASRLAGAPARLRYVWPDPSQLLPWLAS